ERGGVDERAVHRQRDADVVGGGAQPGDEARDRRPDLRPVVEQRKRERQRIRLLPHGDALAAGLAEHTPRPRGQRLAVELRQRLRRAEAAARSADEQDPRQLSIRHGSVYTLARPPRTKPQTVTPRSAARSTARL